MRMLTIPVLLLAALACADDIYNQYEQSPIGQRAHVKDIPFLFFEKNKTTKASRKNAYFPQIVLSPCEASENDIPANITCYNIGFDANTRMVTWQCEADLPERWLLSETKVVFERWDQTDNEHVVLGSESVYIELKKVNAPKAQPAKPASQYDKAKKAQTNAASNRASSQSAMPPPGAVHILDVPEIHLRSTHWAASNRGAKVGQLEFIDNHMPSPPMAAIPNVMNCKNKGVRRGQTLPEWSCTATPGNGWRLRDVAVTCEGWRHPGDSYIVPNSCSATFGLEVDYTPNQSSYTYHTYTTNTGPTRHTTRREERTQSAHVNIQVNKYEAEDLLWPAVIAGSVVAIIVVSAIIGKTNERRKEEKMKEEENERKEREEQENQTTRTNVSYAQTYLR